MAEPVCAGRPDGYRTAAPGSWLNRSKKKKKKQRPSRDLPPKVKPEWTPWNDAEMRMKSEVARRPTCPECGFSNGDHARMCSRR
jgi:hypothetical protein